jgi:hypothetical protein
MAVAGMLSACDDSRGREYYTRMAVKGLVTAPAGKERMQMGKVVAKGSHALPDIEQEYHGADPASRLLLLEALERINDRQALPFVRYVARWDEDPKARKLASRVSKSLGPPAAASSAPASSN